MSLRAAPIRVACVGDSITFGAYIPDRETAAYPARLQTLSNGRLVTTNLGVSGHTLIKAGKQSWWHSSAFAEAATFRPDVVVIMLGTCDTAEPEKLEAFESDLNALLDYFTSFPSAPRILMATPPPIPTLRQWKLNWRLKHRIIPSIHHVSQTRNTPVIEVNAALQGRPDLFPDAIHPNAEGAAIIAQTVWDSLRAQHLLE